MTIFIGFSVLSRGGGGTGLFVPSEINFAPLEIVFALPEKKPG
jgi:hypothetical protein